MNFICRNLVLLLGAFLCASCGVSAFQPPACRSACTTLPDVATRPWAPLHVSLSTPPSEKQAPPSSSISHRSTDNLQPMSPLEASIAKITMQSYIAAMCVALPVTLLPLALLQQTNIISKPHSEHLALQVLPAALETAGVCECTHECESVTEELIRVGQL